MAGDKSSFLSETNILKKTGELSFTFDFESDAVVHYSFPNEFSTDHYVKVSGELEFIPEKRFFIWRYAAACLLLGLLGTGIAYQGSYPQDMKVAAGLHSTISSEKAPQAETSLKKINVSPVTIAALEHVKEKTTIPQQRKAESLIVQEKTLPPSSIPNELEAIVEVEVNKPVVSVQKAEEPKHSTLVEKKKSEISLPTTFHTANLSEAKAWSEKTGRYVFIKFRADWCMPCKLMENTAMKESSIVNLLQEKFIVLDVDIETFEGINIKESFYVDRLPTLVILDELGNQLRREEQALGTVAILEMLESVTPYIQLEEEVLTLESDQGLEAMK